MTNLYGRHRNIIDFALSSLLRRRGKNISLLLVYTLIVFVIASLIFFVQSLKREAGLILKDAPDMVIQRLLAGRHDLIPDNYAEQIRGIRGVKAVQPRLWGYYYDAVVAANYTMIASTTTPALEPGTIEIGSGVARTRQISNGDIMTFRGADGNTVIFQVTKILPSDSELVAADMIVMSPEDFRTMFRMPPHMATDLALTAGNPRELSTIATKVVERFPDARPILKSEIMRTYDSIFDWRGGMMIVVLAAALLSFVIFAWDKASGLSAEERKEIGILKSIGWETSDVLMLKFWEGTVVSLTAFLAGVVLAYGHVFFFSASLFEHALKGWSVLYPHFQLAPAIDPFQLTLLFFLSVVPYTVATIVPAWLAASSDPDAAMRS